MADIRTFLREDKDFFDDYREKFIKKFKEKLIELDLLNNIEGNLDFILETVYDRLIKFSRKSKDKNELVKSFILKFLKKNVPVRDILLAIFADLITDYVNYLKRKPAGAFEIKKLKELVNLLDEYIAWIDEIFAEYLEQLNAKQKEKNIYFEPKEAQDILKHLKESGISQLQVLYLYKHFPIPCRCPIFSISDMFIKTKKCPYKVFVPTERVYIKVPKTDKWAVAEITNVQGDYMYLQPLKYLEDFNPPKQVRVFPEKEIPVRIETPEGTVYGYIDFISFEELGVITSSADRLKENTKVKVHFTLPTGEVYIPATIRKIEPLNGAYTVYMELEPDQRAEQYISRYVLRRQQEIMKELKI